MYLTWSVIQNKRRCFPATTKVFDTFSPYSIYAWSKFDDKMRNIESIDIFKATILKFIRHKENSVFDLHDGINNGCLRLNLGP